MRIEYCCSDYEEVNDTCVECPDGFSSRYGSSCTPCNYGLYGKRCLLPCNCTSDERCDNVLGCQLDESFTYDLTPTGKSISDNSMPVSTTHYHSTVKGTEITVKNEHGYSTSQMFDTNTKSEGDYNGVSKSAFIMYASLTTCAIIILLLCLLCNKYKNIRSVTISKTTGDSSAQQDENMEMEDIGYHVIDESAMIDSVENIALERHYLEVVDTSSSSGREESVDGHSLSNIHVEQNPILATSFPVNLPSNLIFEQETAQSSDKNSGNIQTVMNQRTNDVDDASVLQISDISDKTSSSSESDTNIPCYRNVYQPLMKNLPLSIKENHEYYETQEVEICKDNE